MNITIAKVQVPCQMLYVKKEQEDKFSTDGISKDDFVRWRYNCLKYDTLVKHLGIIDNCLYLFRMQ